MHPTIAAFTADAERNDRSRLPDLLGPEVKFLPPTYWKTWVGREPVAALLGHVMDVFSEFRYRRIIGEGRDWALEFQCRVGDLDAVGVDLVTLGEDGLIDRFEVVMRPVKSVAALREEMNARVMSDPRFLKYRSALQ